MKELIKRLFCRHVRQIPWAKIDCEGRIAITWYCSGCDKIRKVTI